nr:peptidoglycan glycosyltransferase [Odoribacter sp.]
VVYSAAIHHGARLDAYYPNELKTYAEYNNWTPRNSDNKYEGFYTLKGALSKSINTIAVDVLLQTGIDTVINHARRLGITSALPPYPSLALGVANLSLQEMINPFLCFADNGRFAPQYYLSEIRDREGNILFKTVPETATEALPAHEAHLMSNILASVINEGTGQRLRSTYGLTNELAGKTGTTQNQVDGWFIGYNPKIVIGVRVGANDVNIHFNSIRLGQGASMALPIFGELMHRCVDSYTYENWNNLTFPVILPHDEKRMDIPEFKEQLNVIDRLTNRKLEKTEYPDLQEKKKERKEGFFKRLFGKKNQ